ncbi:MAG: M48 family metallopeptidase [Nanoarchaeota archaeon]
MNIYKAIASNKTKTVVFIFLFIVFFSLVFYLIGYSIGNPKFYFIIGLFLSIATGFASYFYSDKYILFLTKAIPATKSKYFDFYTVAENLAIASGLPKPKLYVIESPALNAFATGRNPKHSLICVTTGLLEKLDRIELEGVISHELSHIKNYDILIASIVSVLAGTLMIAIDFISRGWIYGTRIDRENRNLSYLKVIILLVVFIITPIVASLIQLAISRKREFLADANGALLTRLPDGLAQALEKISTDQNSLKSVSMSTAHLFISNPIKKKQLSSRLALLFSTHPPIEERIKILRQM